MTPPLLTHPDEAQRLVDRLEQRVPDFLTMRSACDLTQAERIAVCAFLAGRNPDLYREAVSCAMDVLS